VVDDVGEVTSVCGSVSEMARVGGSSAQAGELVDGE
jgi:hypothetical protein